MLLYIYSHHKLQSDPTSDAVFIISWSTFVSIVTNNILNTKDNQGMHYRQKPTGHFLFPIFILSSTFQPPALNGLPMHYALLISIFLMIVFFFFFPTLSK